MEGTAFTQPLLDEVIDASVGDAFDIALAESHTG